MLSKNKVIVRECDSDSCHFRFPEAGENNQTLSCPKCGSRTKIVFEDDLSSQISHNKYNYPNAKNIICLFDNIRSVYNVGSMFRTMQGFGIGEAYLCGISPTPDHKNFFKTSMGAEETICWHTTRNALKTCQSLKEKGYFLITLETSANAYPIMDFKPVETKEKTVIIVGNEVTGVDPSIIDLSDVVLSIPIAGKNRSLNVTVAFGIGLYACLTV